MKSGNVLLGVLAGIAAGAVLGILFAPDKGESTRKKLLSKRDEYADTLKEKIDDMVNTITKKSEDTLQKAEDMVNKGKKKYEEVKKDLNNTSL